MEEIEELANESAEDERLKRPPLPPRRYEPDPPAPPTCAQRRGIAAARRKMAERHQPPELRIDARRRRTAARVLGTVPGGVRRVTIIRSGA